MKIRATLFLVGSLFFATPLLAGTSVADLVAESGLSKQEVRMLIGAHTPHAGYRVGFERTRKQLVEAIGRARYKELVAAVQRDPETALASAG